MAMRSLIEKLATILAVAALCSAAAGCVSDMGTPTADSGTSGQMRYYGGPKSPMWQSQ